MAFTESDWSAYCPITINSAQVPAGMPDGGESGFPAVLVIDQANSVNYEGGAANIFTTVVDYTKDIAITLNDGSTQLKHTTVEYNAADGSRLLVCHILVPSVASAADTVLRLYYRDNGTTDQQQTVYLNADGWAARYGLHESAAGTGTADVYKDLSDNGNDGDDEVSAAGKTGKVGLGQDFESGSSDYIACGNDVSLEITGAITLSAWLKPESLSGVNNTFWVFGKRSTLSPCSYGMVLGPYASNTNIPTFLFNDGTWREATASTDIGTGTWKQVVITFNETTDAVLFYLDGSLDNTDSIAADMPNSDTYYLSLGRAGAHDDYYYDGSADEIAIASTDRSADWIATTYNCQNDNDAFWTVGSEVPTTAAYSHANGGLAIFLGGEMEAVVARLAGGGLAVFNGGEREAVSAVVANGGEIIFLGGSTALQTFLRVYLEGYPVVKLLKGKPLDKLLEGYPVIEKFGGKPTS